MAQPASFGTADNPGVDVTTYYVVSASLTPETPAPPFQVGTLITANNGSEFVFVQASTSITLGDFVAFNNSFVAKSLSNTTVTSSLGATIASAGAVVRQSLTLIPDGAYFWAQRRGNSVPGNANMAITGLLAAAPVQLFTSANTVGIVTTITTSSSLAAGLAGIECISSTTPLFNLTWPRTVSVYSSAGGTLSLIGAN